MRNRNIVRRRGFTIIELLVVLAIIMMLIALSYGLSPRLQDRKKMQRGTDQVASALVIAKQRAKRDRVPTGIRLVDNGGSIRTMIYIQQPDDFSGGMLDIARAAAPQKLPQTLNFTGVDFTNEVQPGDYIEVNGGGLAHQISGVSANTLTLAIDPDASCYLSGPTSIYRIIRNPRVLVGESAVTLTDGIAIDKARCKNVPDTMDILFSPGGAVLSMRGGIFNQDPTCPGVTLWVRDTTVPDMEGMPALVTIYTTTGFIATHRVNTNTGAGDTDPYSFPKKARSGGM